MTPDDYGIRLKGNHSQKTECPKCQHLRKNKHDKPLSVTIDAKGFVFYCHHCGYKGPKPEGAGLARSQRPERGSGKRAWMEKFKSYKW